jgi:addiction module RelE/StbE family toxin
MSSSNPRSSSRVSWCGERDYKRETKGRSASYVRKLDGDPAAVVGVLAADGTLEERHKDHALTGNWKDHRDCHIRERSGADLSQAR